MSKLGNIYIESELSKGVLMHPTLPVTFVGETIVLPDTTSTAAALTVEFETLQEYDEPFFITSGSTYCFYVQISPVDGFKNKFRAYFERSYYYLEQRRYYRGEGQPIYRPGYSITVGGIRG